MNVPHWEMAAARAAYEAYCDYTGGKSLVFGDNLPSWDVLPGQICNAWHAAIKAAVRAADSSAESEDRANTIVARELLNCGKYR